ncbi:MAG: bifunctional precorrin-2 dehydrogenase/sirohydrochlorin ferrochelatase [Eubacteriales bacterium]|nr:bifunctional precorrin-2 dehydrogenase/sirohydrochlorin ferrochelatase [Bacillota bacterium]MDQ7789162.1 bifunctional precorrin-2 dehydrogenase/sirohydrochlorin ferrochelatase [Clostridia bacterium]MDZ4042338.1 bifunctional precorrin-2 dehydrogenase/sirohydrochlorin ferrochelatase [Eubacteriales bacterium]MDZ7610150.1 bifunctional precorrin-2 dehydrogenase/sirohydrochlorin ferrochelatase [Eubacteriales bacterium]
MQRIYPVALILDGQLSVVVGGGSVAHRKVCSLLDAGARVRVISPVLAGELQEMQEQNRIEVDLRPYRSGDVDGAFLVISATNDSTVNQEVAADCAARQILINSVDDPEHCTFYVPAVVRRGDLVISISTGGKSPMLARKIRQQLESHYGPVYGRYLELIGEMRHNIVRSVQDATEKEALLEALSTPQILDALEQGDSAMLEELVARVVRGTGFESPHGPA